MKKGKHPKGGFLKGNIPFNKGKNLIGNHKIKLLEFNHKRKGIPLTDKHRKAISEGILKTMVYGKNHHSYINGEGYRGYCLEFVIIRPKILKRDNYTCQCCNQYGTERHNILTVHHIDYNKKNNKKSNLITLCLRCNIKANWNVDYWFAYFTYIIREKGVTKIG
jgi:hypothetical protein